MSSAQFRKEFKVNSKYKLKKEMAHRDNIRGKEKTVKVWGMKDILKDNSPK